MLAAVHLAGVGFVVVAGEMDKAVENEDLQLNRKRVALLDGLAAGGGDADGDVARNFFRGFELWTRFKAGKERTSVGLFFPRKRRLRLRRAGQW